MAFASGLGLSMLLWLVWSVVLFQFFWSEGLYLGFWITLGISVILAIVAVARRSGSMNRSATGMPCWPAYVLPRGSWQQMRPWNKAYMQCAVEPRQNDVAHQPYC